MLLVDVVAVPSRTTFDASSSRRNRRASCPQPQQSRQKRTQKHDCQLSFDVRFINEDGPIGGTGGAKYLTMSGSRWIERGNPAEELMG